MIKQAIKKTKFGQALVAIKKVYRSDEYRQWFHDFADCHSVFKFYEYGALNDGNALYVINNLNPSSGFFYSWCETCRGLMVAERFGFTPVVDWSKGAYYDKNGWNGCMNPFEYFFEPVSAVSLDEALKSRNVAYYDQHTFGKPFALYDYRSDDELECFARINRKYIRLRQDLRVQLESETGALLGAKKTLAVHVRGVEWGNVKYHPIPASLEEYTARIDKAISEYGYEQIFLATDSDDTVTFFKMKYGDMVVCYGDVIRAQSGSKVLAIFDDSIADEHKGFRLGYEVLKDMLTISKCYGIIAGLSYVSFAAEVFKRERGETYQYKDYVKMKLNSNGISPDDVPMLSKGEKECPSKSKNR